jgi:hypothetical protein
MIARPHGIMGQGIAVEYVGVVRGGMCHSAGAYEVVQPESLVDVAGESPLRPVREVARGI